MKYASGSDTTFVVYDTSTGRIKRQCIYPAKILDNIRLDVGEAIHVLSEKERVVSNVFFRLDSTHYIEEVDGSVRLRRKGDFTLELVPLPCTVTIEDVKYHCTEQPVFEFDAPGSYAIEVDAGPRYLKKEFVIDNQA